MVEIEVFSVEAMNPDDPLSVLRAIVANGCIVASEVDGSLHCHFCNAFVEVDEPHRVDCAFTAAERLTASPRQ